MKLQSPIKLDLEDKRKLKKLTKPFSILTTPFSVAKEHLTDLKNGYINQRKCRRG